MAVIYEAERLRRSYGGRAVVEDYSAVIDEGEVAVLVGPNGCGKTTSVEMSLGLRRADSGSARICGFDVHAQPGPAGASVGVALQHASLHPRVRVREHLEFFAALYRTGSWPFELAALMGLDAQVLASPYGSLSGGQQRRVLTTVALAGRPPLVVLDEPTSGVDIESRMTLWDSVRAVQDGTGSAFLLTTHDLAEAEQYADKVIVMRAGRVTFTGSVGEYTSRSGLRDVVVLRSSSGITRAALPVVDAIELRSSPRDLTLGLRDPRHARILLDWVEQQPDDRRPTLAARQPTFEDAYLASHGATVPLAEPGEAS